MARRGARERSRRAIGDRARSAGRGPASRSPGWPIVVLILRRRLGGRQVALRRSLADPHAVPRAAGRHRARAAVHVADRDRPVAAAHLGRRRRPSSRRPSATAPPLGLILLGAGALHVPRGARSGSCVGGAARPRARRSASSTRGSPSGRSCRTSSPRQTVPILAISPLIVVATEGGLGLGRDHRDLPDVLPGHDRGAARACAPPTRARSS